MLNLHIVRNTVTYDSRVLKESRFLLESGLFSRLEVCGFDEAESESELEDGRRIRRIALRSRALPKDLLSQSVKYLEWHARVVNLYRKETLGVIHCHDLEPLAIGVHLKQLTGARLVYDAHELESERHGSRVFRKRLGFWMERRLIPSVDSMITVSPSILKWYEERFPRVSIHLVRNIPELPGDPAPSRPLRKSLEVPEDALLFLYIGGLTGGRGIETILKVFQDRQIKHHVAFLGSGALATLVQVSSRSCPRIHLLERVSPDEVLSYVAGADVGLCLIEDTCLSYRFCLPNKLFETLLAGIPVLASDLPDQAAIVRKHNAGWVVRNEEHSVRHLLLHLSVGEARQVRSGLTERVKQLRWRNEVHGLLGAYNAAGFPGTSKGHE
jgi:glycosyltransferase involved in cell wall biosynthesis